MVAFTSRFAVVLGLRQLCHRRANCASRWGDLGVRRQRRYSAAVTCSGLRGPGWPGDVSARTGRCVDPCQHLTLGQPSHRGDLHRVSDRTGKDRSAMLAGRDSLSASPVCSIAWVDTVDRIDRARLRLRSPCPFSSHSLVPPLPGQHTISPITPCSVDAKTPSTRRPYLPFATVVACSRVFCASMSLAPPPPGGTQRDGFPALHS